MANKTEFKYHAGNPANQPFVGAGRKNKTKVRSWWNAVSPTYWANRKSK